MPPCAHAVSTVRAIGVKIRLVDSHHIPIKAVAIILRARDGALLVVENTDPATGIGYQRGLGGQVEFGEKSEETVVRELNEEIGEAVRVVKLLGVLENHFSYAGALAHEIVFVHEAEFVNPEAYERATFTFLDATEGDEKSHPVSWRARSAEFPLMVPPGVERLLDVPGASA